jgi:hypothetical protein
VLWWKEHLHGIDHCRCSGTAPWSSSLVEEFYLCSSLLFFSFFSHFLLIFFFFLFLALESSCFFSQEVDTLDFDGSCHEVLKKQVGPRR